MLCPSTIALLQVGTPLAFVGAAAMFVLLLVELNKTVRVARPTQRVPHPAPQHAASNAALRLALA